MIARLGMLGDEDVLKEAQLRFEKHIDGSQLVPADLRSPVYRIVLSAGDETTFDTMLKVCYFIISFLKNIHLVCIPQLYRSANMQEEKDRISRALGALKDQKLLQRVLDFSLSVSDWCIYCLLW